MIALEQNAVGAATPAATNPARWVEEHGDCLFRYAIVRVRREDVAEDLVQETLLAAVRTHERFSGRSTERSWLVGILKNKISDWFRKVGRETSFTDLEFFRDEHSERFDADNFWVHERGPGDWQHEGEEAVRRGEFWEALHACIARLPERVAQVYMMRELDELPSREICARLGITEANFWVMLHRARMALREDLEQTYFCGKGGSRP